MRYKYIGITRSQEKVTGVVEAQDETEAKMRLRSMAVRPTFLAPAKERGERGSGKSGAKRSFSFGSPVKPKALVVFTRQFSSLIDSGVPVVQCLDILYQQEKTGPFKSILAQIKTDIEGGGGLSQALGKHPKAFSEFFIRIVEAGEISGTLDKALRRVGLQLERLGQIKSKVIGAMIYPCITVVVAIGALIFLLVKVIPEVAKLYGESNAKLPEITLNVLAMSDWVQSNYLLLIGGMGGLFFGLPALYQVPAFRKVWDPFILRVPAFGPLIKKSAIAQCARTLSTLIASGVPLLTAFEICNKLVSNIAIKATIDAARASVTEGKSITQGLAQGNLFPPMVLHMVSIGEMTGKLDDLLGKVADIFDDEVDDAVSTVTGLIQPLLIVIVGAIIAFLLMAMYLPIFQLAANVSG